MHKMRTIAIDDSVALPVYHAGLVIRQTEPLGCGHYYITVASGYLCC